MTSKPTLKRWIGIFAVGLIATIAGTAWYLSVRAKNMSNVTNWIETQDLGLVRFTWQEADKGYQPIGDGLHGASWIRRSWGGIDDVTIRDASLANLAPITNADTVRFASIVTQQELDIAPLARLRQLEQLTLSARLVKSLSPLQGLPKLKTLLIIDTEIPKNAVAEFQLARPDIQLQFVRSSDNPNVITEP